MKSKPRKTSGQVPVMREQKLVDRNLAGVNPLKEQFEPKGQEPVRQHASMAGQP